MIKKMVMDAERLHEVTGLSRIGLPEDEYQEVLDRVNAVLRMCDEMQELDHESVKPFEWDVKKAPERRADIPSKWEKRDEFIAESPIRDGDFYRVPKIISLEEDTGISGEVK